MLTIHWNRLREILCLGAHPDDIEIGCGATVLSLLRVQADVKIHWIVFSGDNSRAAEARASAMRYAEWPKDWPAFSVRRGDFPYVDIQNFRDSFFPYSGSQIKEYFETLKRQVAPDVIFTHYGADLHQDHRIISELTWNTFRDHVIMEYEVPKYDGGLGSPNVFVPIPLEVVQRKVQLLHECFGSQRDKPWFDADTFRALMRLRGVECNAPSGFAEAFYVRKVCLATGDD